MKRLFAALTVVLLVSGCICCGGKGINDLIPSKGSGSDESGIDEPSSDDGSDSSGDLSAESEDDDSSEDEETTTTLPEEDVTTETTLPTADDAQGEEADQTTTTMGSASASTTLPAAKSTAVYQCVAGIGMDPNKVYYAYSPSCGNKFISDASMVSIRVGVDIRPINIAVSTDQPAIKLMECFFGPYSDNNPNFKSCPQLLCPKTGSQKILSGLGQASVSSQMSGFAKNCK